MQPCAKSLILDLLSTLRRGAMPVRALVEAAELFGIGENSLRVALARLRAAGLVERDERGQYALGARAQAIQQQVTTWRQLEARIRPWRRGWIGVQSGAHSRSDRPALRRRTRALHLLGFRKLVPGLELRPNNLAGGVPAVRTLVHTLGVEPNALVFAVSELDEDAEQRAHELWDVTGLCTAYEKTQRELEASAERLPSLERNAAMVESFLLGGRAIRQLVLDPLLPESIAPVAPRRALLEALRRYDRLGRACWAGRLGGSAKTPRSTPANLGGLDATEHLIVPMTGDAR